MCVRGRAGDITSLQVLMGISIRGRNTDDAEKREMTQQRSPSQATGNGVKGTAGGVAGGAREGHSR